MSDNSKNYRLGNRFTSDDAREYVLSKLEIHCQATIDALLSIDLDELAKAQNLPAPYLKELNDKLVEEYKNEKKRLRDRVMFIRNGKK